MSSCLHDIQDLDTPEPAGTASNYNTVLEVDKSISFEDCRLGRLLSKITVWIQLLEGEDVLFFLFCIIANSMAWVLDRWLKKTSNDSLPNQKSNQQIAQK